MLAARINDVRNEFMELDSEMLHYSFLVALSSNVPAEIPEIMTAEHLLKKCQSQVWIKLRLDDGEKLQIQATSDTLIIRGLLFVIMQLLNGCSVEEISNSYLDIFDICKLKNSFSSTRTDGITALLKKVKTFCHSAWMERP